MKSFVKKWKRLTENNKLLIKKSTQLHNLKTIWNRVQPTRDYNELLSIQSYDVAKRWLEENKSYLNPHLERHFFNRVEEL